MSEPVIEVRDLSFAFPGGPPVLEQVNFSLDQLDFATVIGPNGGGKTTLLKLLLGLLEPDQGVLRVLGTTPVRARSRIGYMPQNAQMDPRFPVQVLDVVAMGRLSRRRLVGPLRRSDTEAAVQTLARVGLSGFERRPFSALSGGQRQRVLLARALVCEPELLLLDEPDAGLDQKVELDFFDLLRELNQRVAIVLVSHDLGFVSTFVKTVICVSRRVHVHPTSEVDGRMISEIYGGDVHMVRHDHSVGA